MSDLWPLVSCEKGGKMEYLLIFIILLMALSLLKNK